jgi:opacity protein-like surface antigen
MKKGLFLAGLILLLMSSSSYALDLDGAKAIQGRFGVAIPITGDFSDTYDPSLTLGTGFLFGLGTNMIVEGNFDFGMFSGELEIAGETFDADLDLIKVTGGIRYFFLTEGMMPYLAGGLGLFHWSNGDSTSDFGIDYGAGLMYEITDSVVLDIPVRFNSVFSDPDTINFISVTGGIGIFF